MLLTYVEMILMMWLHAILLRRNSVRVHEMNLVLRDAFFANCPAMAFREWSATCKAWSPYSCNNRRTCLLSCSKEGFKAINISIANIPCEIWISPTITHYVKTKKYMEMLKNVSLNMCLRSLRLLWRPDLTCPPCNSCCHPFRLATIAQSILVLHGAIFMQLVSQHWKKRSNASCRSHVTRYNPELQLAMV